MNILCNSIALTFRSGLKDSQVYSPIAIGVMNLLTIKSRFFSTLTRFLVKVVIMSKLFFGFLTTNYGNARACRCMVAGGYQEQQAIPVVVGYQLHAESSALVLVV